MLGERGDPLQGVFQKAPLFPRADHADGQLGENGRVLTQSFGEPRAVGHLVSHLLQNSLERDVPRLLDQQVERSEQRHARSQQIRELRVEDAQDAGRHATTLVVSMSHRRLSHRDLHREQTASRQLPERLALVGRRERSFALLPGKLAGDVTKVGHGGERCLRSGVRDQKVEKRIQQSANGREQFAGRIQGLFTQRGDSGVDRSHFASHPATV